MNETVIYTVKPVTGGSSVPVFETTACEKETGKAYADHKVYVFEGADKDGFKKIKWGTSIGWIAATNVEKEKETTEKSLGQEAGERISEEMQSVNEYEDTEIKETDEERLRRLSRYIGWSFGAPPKFNMDVDLQYCDDLFPGYGRIISKTILTHPSILSICPGKVDFLPGFTKKDTDNFFDLLKKGLGGESTDAGILDKMTADNGLGTGKIYQFSNAFNSYAKIFNCLCRACAIIRGIGDEPMPNTSARLKDFDYAYWQQRNAKNDYGSKKGIFGDIKDGFISTASGAVTDSMYMHYYINNSETSVSESATTGVESSMIEETINGTAINQYAKNLNYLFGGAVGDTTANEAFKFLQDNNLFLGDDFFSKLGKAATGYVQGGRMIFPQMLGDIQWSQSISCSVTFVSLYGDPISIFLNCIVPVMSLMAFSYPKQLSENMYTYPFIIRAYEPGRFTTDLAVIPEIRITRGGQDETSWTEDGMATEWNVQFEICPLYNELMVTSSDNPLLFLQNNGLIEYLGNICGLDLKTNNLDVKIKLGVDMLLNRVRDIPTNAGRLAGTFLTNHLEKIFQFVNG